MNSRVKFFLFLGILIFGLAVFGYFKAISQPENKENLPKIEITPSVYDFGEIKYGSVVKFSFKVKNLGKAILEIKRVATSCACTTAKINKEKINSDEEAELLVIYDTGAMGGLHGKGKQERIIYVRSNDPMNPQIEIIISALVK